MEMCGSISSPYCYGMTKASIGWDYQFQKHLDILEEQYIC
jgi:hypothetical protein